MIQRASVIHSDRPFNSAYWLDLMQQWAQQYNRLVCCILSFPLLKRTDLCWGEERQAVDQLIFFIKTWRLLFSTHTCRAVSVEEKKNPVSCLTWGVLRGSNEHRFNWHIFKWSFDLRRTVALNVWTQAEGEINKKGTHQRVLTVSVSPEVSSVSGLTAGRPWCRWCCGVRTPQARWRERTNGGVELCGLRERKTQWAISPRQGLSWLLQKLHALIGPEERGGRRKMRPHWRMKRRQTHWLDTLLIHRQKKTVFMRHV